MINWNFLKAVLLAMKFDVKWINWIMECVTSVHYTLLVNDSLTKSFKPTKGLRQRDPLSPYLFLMCANVLLIAFLQAEHTNLIKGVKIGKHGSTFTCFLLMTHFSSLKKIIYPLKICRKPLIGTVIYPDNA